GQGKTRLPVPLDLAGGVLEPGRGQLRQVADQLAREGLQVHEGGGLIRARPKLLERTVHARRDLLRRVVGGARALELLGRVGPAAEADRDRRGERLREGRGRHLPREPGPLPGAAEDLPRRERRGRRAVRLLGLAARLGLLRLFPAALAGRL